MPAGRPKSLAIHKIRTDGDTQARCKLDDAAVVEYAESIKRGDKLPPLTVFHDGKEFWLAGGFHRLAAWVRNEAKVVPVQIKKGGKDEAAWYALGDNKTHGLRLTTADKERAIRRAFQLKPNSSGRMVADLVGCSNHFADKIRAELQSTGNIPSCETRVGADGKERKLPPPPAVKAEKPATQAPPPPPEIKRPTTPPPPPSTPQNQVDEVGQELPAGEVTEMFDRSAELTALESDIKRIRSIVADALERADPLFADITPGAWDADSKNVLRHISNCKPYAVCPYCGGAGCKACKNRGWVNKITYDVAPKELKK